MRVRVDEPLRPFLPARRRREVVEVAHDPTASVGHVVQALGVPLTEVGALAVGARPVGPGHRLAEDDELAVAARLRPQPLDGPPRLLLDVHLGTLARRLRLLGVDTAYRNDADDDALVAQAGAEDRLLLTRDRGLLQRRALRRGAYVRGQDPDTQLRDVLDRFRLPLAPWTRCLSCGSVLRPVAKQQVLDRLEPGTRRTQEAFAQCSGCGQVYWRGAHARRLGQVVRRSLGPAAWASGGRAPARVG